MEQSNNRQDSSLNNEKPIEWGGFLNEFLWVCAGVDRKVLRQCPTDYAKYAGIGGTILFTALMAMLSGGYAMYFVFHSVPKAIAFGIFWGLLIFNLDRFIVNTMYSDGKPTISLMEIGSGLPRIIMAIFLGIVISTPLEMKIFEDRINSQLIKNNIERNNQTRDLGQKGNSYLENKVLELEREINQTKEEIQVLEDERKKLESDLKTAQDELAKEGEGRALSGRPGRGPVYIEKQKTVENRQNALDRFNKNKGLEIEKKNKLIEEKQSQIDSYRKQIDDNNIKINDDIEKTNNENGFCVRYEAFSMIKSESTPLNIVSIMIMLLFIIIETVPTFFKMMMSSGPYDDKLRALMCEVRAMSDRRIKEIEDITQTELKISIEKNKARLAAELKANEDILKQLASAQSELIETAIEEWRKQELEKVKANPSAYINSSTTNQQ